MSDFLSTILSFLWSRSGYIFAAVLAIILYELLKAGAKKTARYLTRKKPKVGVGLAIACGIGLALWLFLVVV